MTAGRIEGPRGDSHLTPNAVISGKALGIFDGIICAFLYEEFAQGPLINT